MLMSTMAAERNGVHPELAGARVLVTGLTAAMGVDLVAAFADHKAQLIVQCSETTEEIDTLAVHAEACATRFKLCQQELPSAVAAVKFAQQAAAEAGGLDAVINLIAIGRECFHGLSSLEDIEDLVADKLLAATLMTRVAANRMRLTLGQGLVLNVVRCPEPETAAEHAIVGIVRSALAAMTRGEAQQWAGQAIRINAIGPSGVMGGGVGSCLTSEPDIAALALYLASKRGRSLSGHVFDAQGVAARPCG